MSLQLPYTILYLVSIPVILLGIPYVMLRKTLKDIKTATWGDERRD